MARDELKMQRCCHFYDVMSKDGGVFMCSTEDEAMEVVGLLKSADNFRSMWPPEPASLYPKKFETPF